VNQDLSEFAEPNDKVPGWAPEEAEDAAVPEVEAEAEGDADAEIEDTDDMNEDEDAVADGLNF